jgi:hypothetical protein
MTENTFRTFDQDSYTHCPLWGYHNSGKAKYHGWLFFFFHHSFDWFFFLVWYAEIHSFGLSSKQMKLEAVFKQRDYHSHSISLLGFHTLAQSHGVSFFHCVIFMFNRVSDICFPRCLFSTELRFSLCTQTQRYPLSVLQLSHPGSYLGNISILQKKLNQIIIFGTHEVFSKTQSRSVFSILVSSYRD